MTLQTIASFLDNIFWLLFLVGSTLANYIGARLAHIEGNLPWRSFFTALTTAFATVVLVSMSTETLAVNPLYWICVYIIFAALVTKPALRATLKKAPVPWLFSVLFFAAVFAMRYFFLGVPTIGK
jgi:hypothetical protein